MKKLYWLIWLILLVVCGTDNAEVELRNFYDAGSIQLTLIGDQSYTLYATQPASGGYTTDILDNVDYGIYDWMMVAIKTGYNDTITGQVNINADKIFTVYADFTYSWSDL